MNINKRALSLLIALIILVSAFPLEAAQVEYLPQPSVSPWARYELLDGERSGAFNKNWYFDKNFLEPIKESRLEQLLEQTSQKIESSGLEKDENFQALETKDPRTRADFLKELYNIVAPYESGEEIQKDPIMYMTHRNIAQGYGNNLHLEKIVTTQEACIFVTRLIDDFFNKHDLAAQGLLWKAENKGNTIYLLGSIHEADDSIYPFSNRLMDRFEASDSLYVEADITNYEKADELFFAKIEEMTRNMYYENDQTLEDDLGPELYTDFKTLMERYGMDEENYRKMKPWAAISQIQTLEILDEMNQDFEPLPEEDLELTEEELEKIDREVENIQNPVDYGVDMYLILKAKETSKRIVELESLEFQYDILFDLMFSNPYEELEYQAQIDALRLELNKLLNPIDRDSEEVQAEKEREEAELIEELEKNERQLKLMLDSWRLGDPESLKEILIKSQEEDGDLAAAILGDRDKEMARKIGNILDSQKQETSFIVVGAAHYLMDGMIVDLLRDMGYQVEDLNN